MSVEFRAKQILDNFNQVSSNEFLEVLNHIQEKFQSNITREYLNGKLKIILEKDDEVEKKKLCKNLLPYMAWYLQGI